ncbi:hypothetical protein SY2F82_66460 [Streptomyces sp. Y2F8-2]|nr:hypothetical protein SY2F82_56720 [Streptomyces sp. Y2F8-2]GHK04849.1 hypothetical protein SY2F82_66460 [Streptomyces sp. Y2F8-2]
MFESHAVTLVASLILGKAAFGPSGPVFPPLVPAIGVVTAVIGVLTVTRRAQLLITDVSSSKSASDQHQSPEGLPGRRLIGGVTTAWFARKCRQGTLSSE